MKIYVDSERKQQDDMDKSLSHRLLVLDSDGFSFFFRCSLHWYFVFNRIKLHPELVLKTEHFGAMVCEKQCDAHPNKGIRTTCY